MTRQQLLQGMQTVARVKAADVRRHRLGKWASDPVLGRAESACENCGRVVRIDLSQPLDFQITGPAVGYTDAAGLDFCPALLAEELGEAA